nr:MAG TPA: hypothetical protein [Bacteriophage sp.]
MVQITTLFKSSNSLCRLCNFSSILIMVSIQLYSIMSHSHRYIS